jgi:hypothetical protein
VALYANPLAGISGMGSPASGSDEEPPTVAGAGPGMWVAGAREGEGRWVANETGEGAVGGSVKRVWVASSISEEEGSPESTRSCKAGRSFGEKPPPDKLGQAGGRWEWLGEGGEPLSLERERELEVMMLSPPFLYHILITITDPLCVY